MLVYFRPGPKRGAVCAASDPAKKVAISNAELVCLIFGYWVVAYLLDHVVSAFARESTRARAMTLVIATVESAGKPVNTVCRVKGEYEGAFASRTLKFRRAPFILETPGDKERATTGRLRDRVSWPV